MTRHNADAPSRYEEPQSDRTNEQPLAGIAPALYGEYASLFGNQSQSGNPVGADGAIDFGQSIYPNDSASFSGGLPNQGGDSGNSDQSGLDMSDPRQFQDQLMANAFGAQINGNGDGSYDVNSPMLDAENNPDQAALGMLGTLERGLMGLDSESPGEGDGSGDSGEPNESNDSNRSGRSGFGALGMNSMEAQAWNGWSDDDDEEEENNAYSPE